MSFSNEVRSELARKIPARLCCQQAELLALLTVDGTLMQSLDGEYILRVKAENAATARKIFKLFKMGCGIQASVKIEQRRRFKRTRIYEVNARLSQQELKQLKAVGFIDSGHKLKKRVNWSYITKSCCKRAYLRGVFLSHGFVGRPEGNYHLEIYLHYYPLLLDINKLLSKLGLEGRIVERNRNLVLYIKDSEKIADFLRVVGAHKALLAFENVRIIKSMRNDVNRQVNCETANLAKTINASVRQTELIRKLVSQKGWDGVPPQLQDLARARLNYPDYSLKELGAVLNPPLSKSGAAYRMKKLEILAEENLQKYN